MYKLLFPLTVCLLASSLFSADSSFPFAGTWKLNLAKSKYQGPMKPPKELTMVLQEQGDQVLETDKGVAADGSPISVRDTFTATGGEFKFLEGRPSAGTSLMAAKRKTNSRSADSTVLRDGKVIRTYHDVLSEDGKTIMETIRGTDDQGKPYETVRLFEKQ
jgi:hypothetical protein